MEVALLWYRVYPTHFVHQSTQEVSVEQELLCLHYELKPSIEVSDKKGYIVTTLQIQQNLD